MEGIPSLVDLCVQDEVKNVQHLGNVGNSEFQFLERILPNCTLDQLLKIENRTKGRDLSPVPDEHWKEFYEQRFGVKSMELATGRMKNRGIVVLWSTLFKAKLKELEEKKKRELEEKEKKTSERLKKLYANEAAKKQKRQIQICEKIPPKIREKKKRFFFRPEEDDDEKQDHEEGEKGI